MASALVSLTVGLALLSRPCSPVGATARRPPLRATQPALDAANLPETDEIISFSDAAFGQLLALKAKTAESGGGGGGGGAAAADDEEGLFYLRMGVRAGGCSGMSYVMDVTDAGSIEGSDTVLEYREGIRCVVDAKSLIYLFGLRLDYSDALIGGGFSFHNPNAEESCGCGKSFGV